MSGPMRARRDEEPRPDLAPYEQVTSDGTRANHAARTRAWFHRTTPRAVPQAVTPPAWAAPPRGLDNDYAADRKAAQQAGTDARPAPEHEKPAAPRTTGEPVRHLTWDEISYFIARDFGKFFEEDFHRDVEFDQAIDREPEIE